MCLNINGALGNAKVYCMEKLCQFNPLTQFLVPIDVLQVLFPQNYSHINPEPTNNPKQPTTTVINQELKKTVLAGSYKHMSLRKVVSGETAKRRSHNNKNSAKNTQE